MLSLSKGDKVVIYRPNVVSSDAILDTAIVNGITKAGSISVKSRHGFNYRYDATTGRGKGSARGMIRKALPGEEEELIARERREAIQGMQKREEQDREIAAETKICREWAEKNATITKIETTNCTVNVVDLPLNNYPATLVISFDKSKYGEDNSHLDRLASIWFNHTGTHFTHRGSTLGSHHPQDDNLLDIIADWMRYSVETGDME